MTSDQRPACAYCTSDVECALCYQKRMKERRRELIEERHTTWKARSLKWHRKLNQERRWLARGVSAPILFGALASLVVALLLLVPALVGWRSWAALCTPLMTVAAGFIAWRAHDARTDLEAGKIDQAWVSADRMETFYEGLRARLDAGEDVDRLIRESQQAEAAARFALPDALRKTLERLAGVAVLPEITEAERLRAYEQTDPHLATNCHDMIERLKHNRGAWIQRCRIAARLGLLGPDWDSEERIWEEINRLVGIEQALLQPQAKA